MSNFECSISNVEQHTETLLPCHPERSEGSPINRIPLPQHERSAGEGARYVRTWSIHWRSLGFARDDRNGARDDRKGARDDRVRQGHAAAAGPPGPSIPTGHTEVSTLNYPAPTHDTGGRGISCSRSQPMVSIPPGRPQPTVTWQELANRMSHIAKDAVGGTWVCYLVVGNGEKTKKKDYEERRGWDRPSSLCLSS